MPRWFWSPPAANPIVTGLGLEALGVEMLPRGQVKTDAHYATNIKGLYAIGDAIVGPMLAHKAEDEGMALAEIMAGKAGHVNYGGHSRCGIHHPRSGISVGNRRTTERSRPRLQGRQVPLHGQRPRQGGVSGRGLRQNPRRSRPPTAFLGAHIIGPGAGDLIHEVCVAMEFGASAQDLALTCHAHPTYSEAVREAALACGDGAIHA